MPPLSILIWLPALCGVLGAIVPPWQRRSATGRVDGAASSVARQTRPARPARLEHSGASRCSARSPRWAWRSATSPTTTAAARAAARHRRRLDLHARHPLQARRQRAERVPVGLTTLLFAAATLAANLRSWERPKLFYFHFMLAESAVLGAFLAQDLALFVAFFDLMLIPFYFLIGGWGREPDRVKATIKLVIYTLVGSLLMLAAAIATGVLAAQQGGGHITFVLSSLQALPLSKGSQEWIFLFFAAAFLVKMPAFPLHGWMPDGYRAMPIEVLMVFSGVLSKVGAYGFLAIVLPLFPQAAAHFQMLMLLIALASILYGSVLAFTQTDARLIAGYSSVAQLGFITLGIFALNPQGAQGALLQMVNHGLVVAPLFFIILLLSQRAGGSEDIREMGGIAFRAPVLASLFLIVALATLAMPGSSNFVGEFLILLGVFKAKLAIAIIAFSGVVMASVYALRLFIRAMHNRVGPKVESREISIRDGARARAAGRGDPVPRALPPVRAAPQRRLGEDAPWPGAGARGAHPHAELHHSRRRGDTRRDAHRPSRERSAMNPRSPPPHLKGPHVDFAGLSPLIALLGGAVIVLLVGLLGSHWVRAQAGAGAQPGRARRRAGPDDLAVGRRRSRSSPGRCGSTTCRSLLNIILIAGGAATVLLAWRSRAAREAAHGEFHALLLTSIGGHVPAGERAEHGLAVPRPGAPVDPAVRAVRDAKCAAEHSLESGLKYLIIGSVGSATLLYGLALIYGATGATDFSAIAAALSSGSLATDPLTLTGIALCVAGLCFKASVAPFHQWTPDVYEGAPTPVTAFMAVATKVAALGVFLRFFDVALIERPGRAGARRWRCSRRSRSSSATSARSGSPR